MKKLFYLLILFAFNFSFAQDYSSAVKSYLQNNRAQFELQPQDISDINIASQSFSKSLKATTAYVEQRFEDISIYNTNSPFVLRDGSVISAKVSFVQNVTSKANATVPALTPNIAIIKAANALGLRVPSNLELLSEGIDNTYIFSNGNISLENIPVQLVYQKIEATNGLRLAWDLSIYLLDASHYYSVRIDALTGDLLETTDWVSQCGLPDFSANHNHSRANGESILFEDAMALNKKPLGGAQYRVFALPLRNPSDGADAIVISPENATASPFGWHDTNGVAGAEHTITRGNNVYSYLDLCNTDSGDSPDGGATLNFDFPFNLPQAPADIRDASAVNLFYLNNVIHDVMYQYGFDETSGNFQENNYGNGGLGGDSVNAEAQDGGGTNNANFATPPDGGNPRMQMYLWGGGTGAVADIFTINGGPLAGTYSGVAAGFGAGIPNNLTQDLVLIEDDNAGVSTDPNDGCDNITNGAALNGKIAVIRRGECEFGFKALAAQNNGAVAAIIVNNAAGAPPLMGAGVVGCQVTIPVFSLSDVDGEPIITLLDGGGSVNGSLNGTNVPVSIDGSLDTEIVVHEYSHGISNRLTGGPSSAGCLNTQTTPEQMGEGWSDFFGLAMTIYAGDQGTDIRGMASYASGDPNGIRTYPYSTNFAVNPHTYDDIKTEVAPHGVGSVWAAMLWEMTWDLITEYGFDEDIYNGTGGNNIAMQLVMDGMKLQPCSPGFIDGRDAILEADEIANGGANRCLIWRAFARRGLGLSASQGSSSSKTDGTEAFDVPVECLLGVNDNGSLQNNFIIYPNPSNGEINIKSRYDVGQTTITIFDINGRKVFSQKMDIQNTTSLNASGINSGIYLIKIESEEYSQTSKLIIN